MLDGCTFGWKAAEGRIIMSEALLSSLAAWQNFYVIAAATLLLVIMGIRNAWDIVTYMVIECSQPQNTSQD
jgi:hypothetical protein